MNQLIEAKTSFNQSIFVKLFLRHSTISKIFYWLLVGGGRLVD